MSPRPILTIVTRHMPASRKEELKRLKRSLGPLPGLVQHLIVPDRKEAGLHRSADLLRAVTRFVKGCYVWILDDDDICTAPRLTEKLEELDNSAYPPSVIVVKTKLRKSSGRVVILPYPNVWESKDIAGFHIGSIACPGFIVRNDLYKRAVKEFGKTKRKNCVDWPYLQAVRDAAVNEPIIVYWLDEVAMEAPSKGEGQSIKGGSLARRRRERNRRKAQEK